MARTKPAVIMFAVVYFTLLSCKGKTKFDIITCNFTDNDCLLEISVGEKSYDIHSAKRTYKDNYLKFLWDDSDDLEVKLVIGGKETDRLTARRFDTIISLPPDSLFTRIDVLCNQQGNSYLNATWNYEAEPSIFQLKEDE